MSARQLEDLDHIAYFVDGAQRYSQYRLHVPLENLNISPDLFDGGPTATFLRAIVRNPYVMVTLNVPRIAMQFANTSITQHLLRQHDGDFVFYAQAGGMEDWAAYANEDTVDPQEYYRRGLKLSEELAVAAFPIFPRYAPHFTYRR